MEPKDDVQKLIDEAVKKALYERSRLTGQAGGVARKEALSPRRRKEIARKAARARWALKRSQID